MARVSTTWPVAGILSGVLMLATTAVPVEAYLGRPGLARLQEHLRLSDEQVRAIHQAREEQWESRRALARSLYEARRSLREAILNGGDEATVKTRTAEVQALLTQEMELRVKALQDLARILTPEQRTRLLSLRRWHRPVPLPTAG